MSQPRLVLSSQDLRNLEFGPFREGIEIARLYAGGPNEPSAAILRYAPGARGPEHRHSGYEHIYVLEGSQEDERGVYEAGTLVVNPPGTSHRVSSKIGCVVLVIWQSPVEFVADPS